MDNNKIYDDYNGGNGGNAALRVRLLSSTPNAKRVAFAAIRSCYSPGDSWALYHDEFEKYEAKRATDNLGGSDADRLVREIVGHGHTSTLEHISFTFSVSGLSRACLAQLTRHRIGWSYSVQSQRYVKQSSGSKHGGFDYVLPDLKYVDERREEGLTFATSKGCLAELVRGMDECQRVYDRLVGWGVKAEDARMILPQAATCNLTVTCNLRAFLDGYVKRACNPHAQAEIRTLFKMMATEIVRVEPWISGLLERIVC